MKKLISLILALILVVGCLSGLTFAADAEASYTVDGVTKEGTLAAAVSAVKTKGGTIKLLKDIDFKDEKKSYAIEVNAPITVDLNGKTLNSVTRGIGVTAKAEGMGVTVIKNGSIISKSLNVNCYSGLQMYNVTGWCETQQNVAFYETTGYYNTKNVIDGCVLANPVWGAIAFNHTTKSMSRAFLTVKNSTLVNSKAGGSAVVIQSKAVASNMVLGENMKLMCMGSAATQAALKLHGEKLTKAADKANVEVLGHKLEGLSVWTTPATATVTVNIKDAEVLTGPECVFTPAGGEAKEGTLAEATKALAKTGGTVKLLRDVFFEDSKAGYAISSEQSLVLDLNGKTLNSVVRGIGVGKKAVGTTVIQNGTMITEKITANIEGGGLHVKNVTMWCNTQQCIGVYETTGAWNKYNLIEDSVLGNNVWGSLAFNNSTDMSKYSMTVKNSTIVNGAAAGGNAVVIQTKAVAATMNIGEGVKLMSKAKGETTTSAAIKLTGVELAKASGTASIKIGDHEITGLSVWKDAAEVKAEAAALMKPFDYAIIPAEPTSETAEAGYYAKGGQVKEGTLAEAIAAVSTAGGAIRLYKDIDFKNDKEPYAIASKSSFTLDLNGHHLKSVTRGVSVTGAGFKGVTLITNSKKNRGMFDTEMLNINVSAGGLIVRNVTGYAKTQQNVAYYDGTGKWNEQNLIEGCTFANPIWGAFAFNASSSQEAMAITMKNSTLANVKSSGGNTIVIQSKAVGSNIIAGEGMKFMTYSTGATSYTASAVVFHGEPVTKQGKKEGVTLGDYTFKNLTVYTTPATATVKPIEKTEGPEVQYTVDGVQYKGTMDEAVKAVTNKPGSKIKLLQDYYHTDFTKPYAIQVNDSITLDLNGFTLHSVTRGIGNTNKATGVTTIIDTTGGGMMNTVKLNANIYGGLHVNNVTMWSQTQQNIAVYDETGNWNDQNMIENSIIANPKWGALAFNKSSSMEKYVMHVQNSTLAAVKTSSAVVMQTKAVAPTLDLGEGVTLMATSGTITTNGIKVTGKELTKSNKTGSIEIAGQTFSKLQMFTTPAPLLPPVLPIVSIDCAYTVNGVTTEGPMAEAIAAVSPAGGTIKMLKDYSFIKEARTYALTSDSSFILDLAGHTIKSAGSGINVTGKGVVGTTYITDTVGGGAIITENICVNIEKGALHVNGVTMWSGIQQNISYMETSAAFNGKNVIENSVLGNPAWGALVFNNAKADQTATSFTVKNSTFVNGYKKGGNAISAQTKAIGANVEVGEGMKFMTYATAPVQDIVKNTGLNAVKQGDALENIEIAGKKLTGLTVYKTKAPAVAPQLPTAEGAQIPTSIDPVYVGSNGATIGGVPVVPGGSIPDVAVPKTGK